ncbi:hypothetical protein K474DRAFT_1629677 [Panus rudis PR-1116 ss-1]|nr:hypothetical protein K474DRAFT_1629677 [Panus rudis PR-1116 ss-1]
MDSPTAETPSSADPCFPAPVPQPPSASVRRSLLAYLKPREVHVPNYVWCTLFTALGGFIFGFDTGSIGPITVMPQFLSQFADNAQGTISPTVQGLLVSCILLTASLASVISGPISDRISRTRTIALGAVVFAAGSAIACSASTLVQMFVGRCLAGVGEGLFMSAVTVYAIEIAPASSRGRLGSVVQLLITIGIASGYFVCYGTSRTSSSLSWRLPLVMQCVTASVLAAGCPFLPHSPRWLRHVGRHDEAVKAWEKLGVSAADAEKTDESAQRERENQARQEGHGNRGSWLQEAKQLWTKDVRKRTFLGVFLMGMQNASGIDGVLYYAPVLFSQAGLPGTTASFIASGVSGLVNVICTLSVQFFADSWSRRASMIIGGAIISFSMLIIGSLYATAASDTAAGRWTIIALIYVFVIGFSCSWAITTRIIASEIQPMRTRAAATSLGQCANWAINWVIAFTTPLFLARSSSGPYFLFGACSLITTIVCILWQPETSGASLEEVDKAFEVSPWRSFVPKALHPKFKAGSAANRQRRRSDALVPTEEHELGAPNTSFQHDLYGQQMDIYDMLQGVEMTDRQRDRMIVEELPEVRYNDRWNDVYRLTNIHRP